ncbi:unnamed protein product [Caenorhabditis angaria]|uniref:LITAF domain-containing protein n=1 Tax=Caenorhabditis angaria TaxID=860376 RepID=A0A9P1II39_9PELO|nr:unnamed protein product [Caenorhabditis angaria]
MENKKSSSEPPNLQNQSGPLPESPAPASAATQVSTQALTEAPTQASVSAQPPTPTSTKAPTPENANPKEPPSPCPGAIVVVERKQQRQVVMSIGPKNAPSFGPYDEFCPVCSKIVQTHVEYKMGACAILCLIFCLFFFWLIIPIIFLCCCFCIRDSYHYCPKCRTLLSVKKQC